MYICVRALLYCRVEWQIERVPASAPEDMLTRARGALDWMRACIACELGVSSDDDADQVHLGWRVDVCEKRTHNNFSACDASCRQSMFASTRASYHKIAANAECTRATVVILMLDMCVKCFCVCVVCPYQRRCAYVDDTPPCPDVYNAYVCMHVHMCGNLYCAR